MVASARDGFAGCAWADWAVDELRRQPDCVECRARLLDQLWPLLPNPPTASRSRITPDDSGHRYLDRLQPGVQP